MSERGRRTALGGLRVAGAALLSFLYFFQSSTLGVNHTDEGLILGYIDRMAHGDHPFFDFVDAYGILNWVFPVLFYKAFGYRVFGVRVWMVVLKMISVFVAYALVRGLSRTPAAGADAGSRNSGKLYATLAAGWTALLLGAQWQSLQTAYAFLTVVPEVLGAWYFILCAPFSNPRRNAQAAGILTAVTIWTKLNTGMFLLAGGLFSYFYWIPDRFEGPRAESARPPKPLVLARALGALAYGGLFVFFIRQYFDVWFFLFLVVPLILGVGWSLGVPLREEVDEPARHLTPFVTYLSTTATLGVTILVLYYGKHAFEYVRELRGILSHIKYTAPFPLPGEPGHYVGLNERYWLELPWVVTALFLVWLAVTHHRNRGAELFGTEWPARRARVSSLFVLVTLHTFVMYARADETHVYQAVVLHAPVLFVLLSELDAFVRPSLRSVARLALVALYVMQTLSLLVVPTADSFSIRVSEWQNPKLAHLRYRPAHSPYVREDSPNLTDRDWDQAEDDAAAYVKSISEPDEEILLLTANRLVYLNSDTRPLGGRYHFYFYLVSVGLLDRAGFDALVPRAVLDDILQYPPRVIVGAIGWEPLAAAFPEFAWLRDNNYEKTRNFRHIVIHELRMDGEPVQAPIR
ncbi:MAG TPA: hypothetical protein VHE30_27940 [Polyangiaceae bacterium]|nr:hypothetical protein [Polyangiaceae bacterium]